MIILIISRYAVSPAVKMDYKVGFENVRNVTGQSQAERESSAKSFETGTYIERKTGYEQGFCVFGPLRNIAN